MGLFDDPLEDILSGKSRAQRQAEQTSVHTLRVRVTELEGRLEKLKRRAQNNVDRAWNRAIDRVLSTTNFNATDATLISDLRRDVRHAKEFGES